MVPDILNISILYGTGVPDPDFQKLLEDIPQVQMVGQAQNPEEVLEKKPGPVADLVMVYMNGDDSLPEWLEALTSGLPQTAVLLCSAKMDPEFLLKAMRQGVREVVPLPINQEELEAAFDRVRASRRRLSDATGAGGRILVITGNKGGVGATTVAVNLSVTLARSQPGKVLLVDLGRPYPDVGHFLDRDSMHTIFDLIQNQTNLDQSFMEKTIQPYEKNLALIHGISDFNDQDSIHLEGLRKVFTILKAHYRWVVVDLSHWLDDLFLQVITDSDLVLMLVELTVPDLRNLGHLWPLLRNWMQVKEKMKLVINRYDRGNGLNLGNLEQVLKQKAYFTLPSDYENVSEAINRGLPLANVAPKSKLCASLDGLVQQLLGQLQNGDEAREGRSRRRFWVI
jgi:pilus assembly protein CpaE